MARTISWLKDLHNIRKRIAVTVRSHYTRKELQDLFSIEQSAAAALMKDVLPTTKVANALLVKREDLSAFLDRAQEADDVPALIEKEKKEKAKQGVSRRKLRQLVQRDYDPMSVYGIPETLKLARGKLEINFSSAYNLAETMQKVALILQDDLDEFIRMYEPIAERPQEDDTVEQLRAAFAALNAK